MENITINCNNIEISNNNKICLIAGPCQLETEQHAMDMAGKIKEISSKFNIGFIYKTSFDKANRTSIQGKRGAGLDKSLPIFDKIKKDSNKIFKLLAKAGILVRKMNSYGIKNSLRITIGKSDENKKLILKIKKAINV